jgi:hypothetical protein
MPDVRQVREPVYVFLNNEAIRYFRSPKSGVSLMLVQSRTYD